MELLVPDIHQSLNHTLSSNSSLKLLNSSFIVLIPKIPGASNPKEFRPIILIHGVQRILSKILATRLQVIIHDLVDVNQTEFIKGRQIT
jgi:hypothetical protein